MSTLTLIFYFEEGKEEQFLRNSRDSIDNKNSKHDGGHHKHHITHVHNMHGLILVGLLTAATFMIMYLLSRQPGLHIRNVCFSCYVVKHPAQTRQRGSSKTTGPRLITQVLHRTVSCCIAV